MPEAPARLLMIGVVGGGVAGMSCALWLKHLGYLPLIIEKNHQLGGQLLALPRLNRWVLGHPNQTSVELAETYSQHLQAEGIDVLFDAQLLTIEATAVGFDVGVKQSEQMRQLSLHTIVISTGVRAIGNESFSSIPGFHSLLANKLVSSNPISHLENPSYWNNKQVAIIGGGDNAHFTAKDVVLAGAKVHLLIRSSAKARATIRREIEIMMMNGDISEHTHTNVITFDSKTQGVDITLNTGQVIHCDHVLIRAGFVGNSDFLKHFSALSSIVTEHGYIKTDNGKCTSIPRVYAIGDIANARHQSVVNAIAEGAIAAQDISERVYFNDNES